LLVECLVVLDNFPYFNQRSIWKFHGSFHWKTLGKFHQNSAHFRTTTPNYWHWYLFIYLCFSIFMLYSFYYVFNVAFLYLNWNKKLYKDRLLSIFYLQFHDYRVTPKTTQLSSFRILLTVSKIWITQVSRIRKSQTQKFFISNVFTYYENTCKKSPIQLIIFAGTSE
jgi:hypothetical protein